MMHQPHVLYSYTSTATRLIKPEPTRKEVDVWPYWLRDAWDPTTLDQQTRRQFCVCYGSKYLQSWLIDGAWSKMTCQRCGGEPRPEQDREMADEWVSAMRGPRP